MEKFVFSLKLWVELANEMVSVFLKLRLPGLWAMF